MFRNQLKGFFNSIARSGVKEYISLEHEITGLNAKCGKLLRKSDNLFEKTRNCDGNACIPSREAFAMEKKFLTTNHES